MNKTNNITTGARNDLLWTEKTAIFMGDSTTASIINTARRICGFINNRGKTISGNDIIIGARTGKYGEPIYEKNDCKYYRYDMPTKKQLLIVIPKSFVGCRYIENLSKASKNGIVRIGKHRGTVNYINEYYAVIYK